MNTPTSARTVEEARAKLARIILSAESAMGILAGIPTNAAAPLDDGSEEAERFEQEILHWRKLVESLRDIASDRPDVSGRRGKDAWQGTALLQSSMLAEIARLCGDQLRSTVAGPRPLGTTSAKGPKTEAIATRDGFHIRLEWIRHGVSYSARIYEPMMMDITPALADVLALAVEEPLRKSPANSQEGQSDG